VSIFRKFVSIFSLKLGWHQVCNCRPKSLLRGMIALSQLWLFKLTLLEGAHILPVERASTGAVSRET
jgi:hypothetical protein